MRALLLLAIALCGCALHATAEHWAVIVAGSRGYSNYRHQADACHAYHVVRRHGIPAENVVLMMYDDVAAHKDNPFPGQLFNRPVANASNVAASDVYRGCNVDYRGEDVTPDTFVNVLLGNASGVGGRKVLNSTADDRVFINFIDHGSRGNIYFPHGQPLTASRLNKTLKKMHANNMYKELVFYLEACESGSMFWSWTMSEINAYVTTAANGFESSWGTYCPPLDKINGVPLETCLGDLYSVNWMEDSDLTDLSAESLRLQFERVKKETNKSHVNEFGSTTIRKEIVGNFQSNYDRPAPDDADQGVPPVESDSIGVRSNEGGEVDTHDVDLVLAFYRYLRSAPGEKRSGLADELIQQVREREAADKVFARLRDLYELQVGRPLLAVGETPTETVYECYEHAVRLFERTCSTTLAIPKLSEGRGDSTSLFGGGFSSYSIQYAGVFMDMCANELDTDAMKLIIDQACGEHPAMEIAKTTGGRGAVFSMQESP